MAPDDAAKAEGENACCKVWKDKYLKSEEKRNALRQAVKLLEQQLDKVQAESLNHRKAYEEERSHRDLERVEKDGLFSVRVSLENEIAALKSEISSLQQRIGSEASDGKEKVKLLEAQVSNGKVEVGRLKELIKKEKTRADMERRNAAAEKGRADEAWKIVQAVKAKADDERKVSAAEQRTDEVMLELEKLKKAVGEARSQLVSERAKWEKMNKEVEMEKQRTKKEKQHADMEKAKADEQRKLAEDNYKKLMEERDRSQKLSMEIEGSKRTIEKLHEELQDLRSSVRKSNNPGGGASEKLDVEMVKQDGELCGASKLILTTEKAIINVGKQKGSGEKNRSVSEMLKEGARNVSEKLKKRALDDKSNNKLSKPLEKERGRRESDNQKKSKVGEAPAVSAATGENVESTKVALLKERLKLEKMKAKHAKEVVEFEKCRNNLLMQEIHRLKLDFGEFLQRLDVIDFSLNTAGLSELEKNANVARRLGWKKRFHLDGPFRGQNVFSNPSCVSMATSDDFRQLPLREAWDPTSGVSSTDCVPGTHLKSKLPPRGSNRKILQTAAINSTMASFSDKELVGSQGRGHITATSPKQIEDNLNQQTAISSLSDGDTKAMTGEKSPDIGEDSVRSSLHGSTHGITANGRKRKKLLNVVQSVDQICAQSKNLQAQMEEKLALLHGMVSVQGDKSLKDDRFSKHNSGEEEHERVCKKRKLYHEVDTRKELWHGNEGCKTACFTEANVCGQAHCEFKGDHYVNAENVNGSFYSDNGNSMPFNAVAGSYIKLLELDNPADEQCYRRAAERLLSPSLPELNFESTESAEKDGDEDLHHLVLQDKENASPFCGPEGVNSTRMRFITSVEEGTKSLFENPCGSACDSLPTCFVISSDIKETKSILRIYLAIRSCIIQTNLLSQPGWMLQKILTELPMEEKLTPKEKVCVFFSLILLNFSVAGSGRFGNRFNKDYIRLIDSFAENVKTVMSNVETQRLFIESHQADELLLLIEDFLINGKIIRVGLPSELSMASDRTIEMGLHNVEGLLSSESASKDLLVGGSIVLASMCEMNNQIAFVCEASYQICCGRTYDFQLVLSIVHVFAYLCGKRYLMMSRYSLLMTVLKSLVMFLEASNPSEGSLCPMLVEEVSTEVCVCASCPFSFEASSMDVVISILLERIQKIALTERIQSGLVESINSMKSVDLLYPQLDAYEVLHGKDHTKESSNDDISGTPQAGVICYLRNGVSSAESDVSGTETLCNLDELLSLVELVALNVGWECSKRKIVPQLLKIFESPVLESIFAAVIILLGQLGRHGIKAAGYDDDGVEDLRCSFCSFLRQASALNLGFPTQTCIFTALLWLLPVNFENIMQSTVNASQLLPAGSIREWFCSLSSEQQASVCCLLQSSSVDKI